MVNWDYWIWQKNHRKRRVIARPAGTGRIVTLDDVKRSLGNEMVDSMRLIAEGQADINERVEALEDSIPLPVMSAVSAGFDELRADIADLRESIILNSVLVARIQIKNPVVRDPMPDVMKESHRKLLGMLLDRKVLTYAEIAQFMGIAKSSARVYVSDLEKFGFPIIKADAGGKVIMKIDDIGASRKLLEKYDNEALK